MLDRPLLRRFLRCSVGWSSLLLCLAVCHPVAAYTPEDPVVQEEMVDRGIAYLEGNASKFMTGGFAQSRGDMMLVGYAHFKCVHDPENELVKQGIKAALDYVEEVSGGHADHNHKRNYEIAVAVLLMAEVDPDRYRSQLEILQRDLFKHQQPTGGFGYPGEAQGDISQTQYAILAIWTLDRHGIELDYNAVVRCAQFLMRVQSIDGGWAYKAEDPGPGKGRVSQRNTYSMGLAGGSSILIAGDALRLWGDTVDQADPGIPGLPEAIELYQEDRNKKRRSRVQMTSAPVKQSIGYLQPWLQKNPYKKGGLDWYYYIIYTRERYESFIEIANGSPKDKSPAWYNGIVDDLRQSQEGNGGWEGRSQTAPHISTSFALLFLIRSTQKTIFNVSAGSLAGGYGLPSDTTNIRVDGTQIKGQAIATSVTDMLSILEEDGTADTEGKSIPDNLRLDPDPKARRAQLDRLERLVRGSRSYQARRVAAQLLSKSDELRVVPALIFALGDLDNPTRRFARDGLRFLSRKFEGFGEIPERPTDLEDAVAMGAWRAELEKIQNKWRDWYRSVDPTHVFLDYDL